MKFAAGKASSWLTTVRFISSRLTQTATHLETFSQKRLLPTKDLQDRFLQVSKHNSLSSKTRLRLVMLACDADVMCWRFLRVGFRPKGFRELGWSQSWQCRAKQIWVARANFLSITYPRQDSLEVSLTTVILKWEWDWLGWWMMDSW